MKKKHDDLMKKALIIIAIFLLIFTIVNQVIFCIKGVEPSTLIMSVFAACIGEGSIMGWIKTTKEKNQSEEGKENETDEQDL